MKKLCLGIIITAFTACGNSDVEEKKVETNQQADSGRIVINDSMPHHQDEDSLLPDSLKTHKTIPK